MHALRVLSYSRQWRERALSTLCTDAKLLGWQHCPLAHDSTQPAELPPGA